MKRNYIVLLSCLFLIGFSNCSDDKEEFSEPDVKIKLKLSKETISPFEKLTVSIDLDSDLLWNNYDSVVFKNNGTWWNGIITFPNNDDDRDFHITDYRLGKNKVRATGYKDGVVKSIAEIEYNVEKPTKDFFTINWGGNVEQESNWYQVYRRVSADEDLLRWEGIRVSVDHFLKNKTHEYAILNIMPHRADASGLFSQSAKTKSEDTSLPDIDNYDFYNKMDGDDKELRKEAWLMTRSFWHSYVTLIYGESILKYEGEDVRETSLRDEYNERFKNPLETGIGTTDAYPVEIWETQSTHICMIAIYNGWYYVIAEPR